MSDPSRASGAAGYNQNIQILRAVAVLLVLGFHLQLPGMEWGYLGVDLFFLVSGFLMPLILPKYDAASFLMARVRRIYPALLAAIAACFVLGWFTMMPGEMDGLSQSALAAIFSVSEFWFAGNTGYFDEPQQTHPLLHTWSLGVEFLCYAMVALFLVTVRSERARIKAAAAIAVIAALASIALWWGQGGGMNYFNPLPRIALFFLAFWVSARGWHLATGPALAITGLGVALLAAGFGPSLAAQHFPGPAIGLLPLVGLPVMMMRQSLPLPALLRMPLGWLGDISYSLYIWHWPVIVFQMIAFRNFQIRFWEAPLLAAVSLAVACASYYVLERNHVLRRPVVLVVGAAVLSVAALAGTVSNGFASRLAPELIPYASLDIMRDRAMAECRTDAEGLRFHMPCKPASLHSDTVIFAGDSHARHFMPLFDSVEPHTRVMRHSADAGELAERWPHMRRAAKELGASRIYIAFRWFNEDAEGAAALIEAIEADPLAEAVLVRDLPAYVNSPVACWVQDNANIFNGFCKDDLRAGMAMSRVQNAGSGGNWAIAAASDLPQIDTHAPLCDENACQVLLENVLVYRDNNHLHERLDEQTDRRIYDLLFAEDRQSGRQPGP